MSLCRRTFKLYPFIKALPRTYKAPQLTYQNLARNVSAVAPKAEKINGDISISECLSKIEVEIRTAGKISKSELNMLLKVLSNKESPTSIQVPLILRCCGTVAALENPETRMKYLNEIWKKIQNMDVPLNVSHYNTVLKIHLENEWPFSPEEFLKNMKKNGIEPNRVTYQHILSAHCQKGDLNEATKVLEGMKANEYPLNENVFASLIMGHCVAKDFKGAESVLQLMKDKELDVTAHTYALYLCGLGIVGDMEAIKQVMEKCKEDGITIRGKHMLDVVYHMSVNGHRESASQLMDMVDNKFERHEFLILMFRLLHKKAYESFLDMVEKTITDNIPVRIKFAFRIVGKSGSVEDILNFTEQCKKRGYNAGDPLMEILFYMYLSNTPVSKTVDLLKEMKARNYEIREHFFWPLLAQAVTDADDEEILNVLSTMKEFDVPCSSKALIRIVFYNLEGGKRSFFKILQTCHLHGFDRGNATLMHVYGRLAKHDSNYALSICQSFPLPYHYRGTLALADNLISDKENHVQDIINIMYLWVAQRTLTREYEPWQEDNENRGTKRDPVQADKEFVSRILKRAVDLKATPAFAMEVLKSLSEKGLAITQETGDYIKMKWPSEKMSALVDKTVNCEFDKSYLKILNSNLLKRLTTELTDNERQFKESCKLKKFEEAYKSLTEDPDLDKQEWHNYLIWALRRNNEKSILRSCLERYLDKYKSDPLNFYVMVALMEMEMYEEVVSYIGVSLAKNQHMTYQSRTNLNMFFQELLDKNNKAAVIKMLSLPNLWIVNRGNFKVMVQAYNSRNELDKALEIVKDLPNKSYGRLNGNRVFLPIILDRRDDPEFIDKMLNALEYVGARSKMIGYLLCYACKGDIKGGRQALNSILMEEKVPLGILAGFLRNEEHIPVLENIFKIIKGDDRFLKVHLYERLIQLYHISQKAPQKGLDLWEEMQEEGIPPTALFLKYLSSYMKAYEMKSPFKSVENSDNYLTKLIPEQYLPEVLQHYMSKNNQGLHRVLRKAIAENGIASKDIANLILAAENYNENPSLLKLYSLCLDLANIWNAWNKGELLSYINANLQEECDEGERLAADTLKSIPVIRLVSCMCRGAPTLSFTTDSARVVVWAQCKSDKRYHTLANFLFPYVEEVLKDVAVMKTVLSHTRLMPVMFAQRTLRTLLAEPSFENSPMRFETEKMLNHIYAMSEVQFKEDDGVDSRTVSPLDNNSVEFEGEEAKKASETSSNI